jgi:SAM-dependent methyltransferase
MTRADCACCGRALPAPRLFSPDRLHGVPGRWQVAVCPSCGAGRTLLYAGEDELGRFYPADYLPYAEAPQPRAAALAARALGKLRARRALRTPPLDSVRLLRPGRALDVGCGRGDVGALLIGVGWRVTGVEPSESACAAARSRGIDARPGTLSTVGVERAAYDLVVFIHSLEHTVDPVADLRRVAAALRPGGVVAITVPNFGSRQARWFGSRWFHLDVPRHRHHFTRLGLARALTAAGLHVDRVSTSTSAAGLAGSVQYALAGRWLLRHGLGFRLAVAACETCAPLARLADAGTDERDLLHVVARRPG